MKLRNGKEVTAEMLDGWEYIGLSEAEIAIKLDISHMGLWKVRRRLGCKQKVRSDKGKRRVETTIEEKRAKQREATKRYRDEHPGKCGRNGYRIRGIFVDTVGRYPKKGEVIHHINGDVKDDRRNNLVICTQGYHMSVFHSNSR